MKLTLLVITLCAILPIAEAYDVVLKTGKVIHGTLVKEDNDAFVIKNANGIEFTLRKANVNLEKTTSANKPAGTPSSDQTKKPARVYTTDDIARVRAKINLGTFEGAVPLHFTKAIDENTVKVDRGFQTEVLDSALPVLVDFYADWCGPCRAIAPRVEAVGAEFADKAKVYRVNVDQHEDLSKLYEISSIPTLLFFKDGEIVGRMVGLAPQEEISKHMKELVQ